LPSSKKLHITDAAHKDLLLIAQYTQKSWGEKQKKKYLSYFQSSFEELCQNSHLGIPRHDLYQGLHAYICNKHLIFYLALKYELHIIRVLHQSMDIASQFSENK